MRVAFVFPPYNHKLFEENITIVDEEFGAFPPINLAYAAAIAEKAGHKVILLDANVQLLSKEDVYQKIKKFNAEVVGFYFTTYMFIQTLQWCDFLKDKLDISIIAGGINLKIYPKETLAHNSIDYGLIGDANKSLPALLNAIENNKEPESIYGVCYKKKIYNLKTNLFKQKVIVQKPDDNITPFEDYPFPARHLLPNHLYYSFISKRKNFSIAITSLGCKKKCTFCPMAKMKFMYRSVDSVIKEIKECYYKYNIRELDFFDPDMPCIKKRMYEICEKLIALNLDLEWSCRARVDSLDDDLCKIMSKAGCRQIYVGFETPDEKALKHIKKGITVKQMKYTVDIIKKYDMHVLGFFIIGNPGETIFSIIKTIKFALDLNLDYAQFSRLIAKPCTDLHSYLIDKTGNDYWKNYVSGKVEEKRLESPWTDLSENTIEMWTKIAYYIFYYRPTYIIKALLRIKSYEEFKRSIFVGSEMLFAAFSSDSKKKYKNKYIGTKGRSGLARILGIRSKK